MNEKDMTIAALTQRALDMWHDATRIEIADGCVPWKPGQKVAPFDFASRVYADALITGVIDNVYG